MVILHEIFFLRNLIPLRIIAENTNVSYFIKKKDGLG